MQETKINASIREEESYKYLINPAVIRNNSNSIRPTTVHAIEEEGLKLFKRYVIEYQCDSIFSDLLRDFNKGTVIENEELNPSILLNKTAKDIERLLIKYVFQKTEKELLFLEHGWNSLTYLAQSPIFNDEEKSKIQNYIDDLFSMCAQKLDKRMDFSNDFSEGIIGDRKVWLIAPSNLPLNEPFGQIVRNVNSSKSKFEGQDPLSLTMIMFTLFHSTNSLRKIEDMFRQYIRHIGDHKSDASDLRYPLHTFKNAHHEFDEPHSPLELEFNQDGLTDLIIVAEIFNLVKNNKITLDIRQFEAEPNKLLEDWNRIIELCEKLVQHFENAIDNGQVDLVELLKDPALNGLKQYAQRKIRHLTI
jgi:hypothetical protein